MQHCLESTDQWCRNFLVSGIKCIFSSIIDCHHHWSPTFLPVLISAPAVPLLSFNRRLIISCCRFVSTGNKYFAMGNWIWSGSIEKHRRHMDRKIWQVFDLHCVFFWVLLIALNAVCLSCVSILLHWIFWVFGIFLISFQIWEYLFNFHASHICIFQLKLLALLDWVFISSYYVITLASWSQTVLCFQCKWGMCMHVEISFAG